MSNHLDNAQENFRHNLMVVEQYKEKCQSYLQALESDLKIYQVPTFTGIEYREPQNENSIDHIKWQKRKVIKEALKNISSTPIYKSNIDNFKKYLIDNAATLEKNTRNFHT